MTRRQFQQVEVHTPRFTDQALARFLEPIRDVVQRRFFGRSEERAVSREDLVTLGLITNDDLNKLDDQ